MVEISFVRLVKYIWFFSWMIMIIRLAVWEEVSFYLLLVRFLGNIDLLSIENVIVFLFGMLERVKESILRSGS